MDPQEQGDRIICEIDALMKLENGTFPLKGFTVKDCEPNCQMGSNRFSKAGMALYEFQKSRGQLDSHKKKERGKHTEESTHGSDYGSERSQDPGAHPSSLIRPFSHRSQSTYNREARRRVPEMRSAQFRYKRSSRRRWDFDDKITARSHSPDGELVRSSSLSPASSAAHEYRRESTVYSSTMLPNQIPQEQSATAKSFGYNPYSNWGSGNVPPLSFDWFGPRTTITGSQPPTTTSPDPTSAAAYFQEDAAGKVLGNGLAMEPSSNSHDSPIEAIHSSPAPSSSHIESTAMESATNSSDDGHLQVSSVARRADEKQQVPEAFVSHASSKHIHFSDDISYHLLQPLPEHKDPYTQQRALNDLAESRSLSTSKFRHNTKYDPPREYSATSATFKANSRRHPPPKPYNPYMGKPVRNALAGRFAASRYRIGEANVSESQQRPFASYTKPVRFFDGMPSTARGPTAFLQDPLRTVRSGRSSYARRPPAGPMQAQNANAGPNYRPLGAVSTPREGYFEQSLSLFRASTPPCLSKAPSHAPEKHYVLAAIKASELHREVPEERSDKDSDIIITDDSENGDVDLRVKGPSDKFGSNTLPAPGNNVSGNVPLARWDTCRPALVQANTNRKRLQEDSPVVYLSSGEEVAKVSEQPCGWKGTYVRHPPKYAKHALRRQLEAQRPSRMTLIFERQSGLTDEGLLENANLHLKTMRDSAHNPDPAVTKIHNEELQALKHALKVLQLRIDDNSSDGHARIEHLGAQWKKVLQSVKEWFENESLIRMDIEMQLVLRSLSDFFDRHHQAGFTSDNRY